MINTLKAILFALSASVLLNGCASNVKQNSGYNFPLDVSDTNPSFIFPVSLHGVPGNTIEVGLAITAGATAENGTAVISGQQLYSSVGNLSWTIGENMRRHVNNGQFQMTGSAERVAKDLKHAMEKLTKSLKSSGVISDPNFTFKNVIVLHVDYTGGIQVPGVNRVVAFGGIVDLEKLEVVSYIEKELMLADDHDSILAQMPVEMNRIIDDLIGRS